MRMTTTVLLATALAACSCAHGHDADWAQPASSSARPSEPSSDRGAAASRDERKRDANDLPPPQRDAVASNESDTAALTRHIEEGRQLDVRVAARQPATEAGSSAPDEPTAVAREESAAPSGSEDDTAVPAHRGDAFFGEPDAPVRRALGSEAIETVDHGRGGRSLAFVVTLADGTRGYFKPEQTFNGTQWYAEIAAYHLDRALGLGRAAPVVGRSIAWSDLRAAAGHDRRVSEIVRGEDGSVRGAFVAWVRARPTPLALPAGWESWLRIDEDAPAVSPFQRPGLYRRALARQRAHPTPIDDVASPAQPERPAELSDLVVFDYLAQNLDRWGTHNTNVRTVGRDGPLMLLDNAASFTLRAPRIGLMDRRLEQVQRFRRSTIDAVRRFDVEAFAARLAADPLAPTLSARQLRNLETRRQQLVAHVDALVEEHGEDAVYAW